MSAAPSSLCPNCESPHVQRYCPVCGQENTPSALPLHLVIADVLEEFFKFDAKLWKTLATLMREPGRITREYLQGRRARWVSPIKLYLALIFVQAMLHTFAPTWYPNDLGPEDAGLQRGSALLSGLMPWRRAETTRHPAAFKPDKKVQEHRDACQDVLDQQQKDKQDKEESRRRAWLTGNSTTIALAQVPLYALLFAFFFKRQRRYYIEHLVFTLHLMSGVALIDASGAVAGGLGIPLARVAASVGTLAYAFIATNRVYTERRGRTIGALLGFFVLGQLVQGIAGAGVGIIYSLTPPD